MSRRRRKIKKNAYSIFIIIIIIIIMGGIIMININNKDSSKEDITSSNNELEKEEEPIINQTNSNLNNAPTSNEEFETLEDGEYLTSNGYSLMIENGIAFIDGILIVNKTYNIPSSYQPTNPNNLITGERCEDCLNKEVIEAYNLMKSDARSIGLNLYIASGYRSYNYQDRLYNNYAAVSGIEGADTYSARAGHSEHQTGLSFDLNSVDDSFANTDEGRWVNENAYLYGFVIRYPKGKESVTGYQYESWHLRYVGRELAEKLYNDSNWITIEEYYGLTSNY